MNFVLYLPWRKVLKNRYIRVIRTLAPDSSDSHGLDGILTAGPYDSVPVTLSATQIPYAEIHTYHFQSGVKLRLAEMPSASQNGVTVQVFRMTGSVPAALGSGFRATNMLAILPSPSLSSSSFSDVSGAPVVTIYSPSATAASASASSAAIMAASKKFSAKSNLPTIGIHIATQLLELAQLKHDMCPITAEEFITGETAVMPCGHMFMRFGLEETFKTPVSRNICPSCRQKGNIVIV
jgi:hypothetical protein